MEEGRSLLLKLNGVDLKNPDRPSAVNALLDRLESDAPCKDRATIRRTFRRAWSVLAHEWNSCSDALKALQDVMAEREDEARCAAVDPSDALKFFSWLYTGSQTSSVSQLDNLLRSVLSSDQWRDAVRLNLCQGRSSILEMVADQV